MFTYLVTQAGLASHFEINSAATSREEIGNPPHYGTVDKLRREHIPLILHHARQMTAEDYRYYGLSHWYGYGKYTEHDQDCRRGG